MKGMSVFMESKLKRAGWIVLAGGILMLTGGLICTMLADSLAGPVLLTASIVVNTVGISMLRHER